MLRELFHFQYHCCQKLKINWDQNHQISQSHWNGLYCYCYCCYYYYLISFGRIKAIQQIKLCLGFEWTGINYSIVCISNGLIAPNFAARSAGIKFKLTPPVHKNCLCLCNFHHGILKHLISYSDWVKNPRCNWASILTVLKKTQGNDVKPPGPTAPHPAQLLFSCHQPWMLGWEKIHCSIQEWRPLTYSIKGKLIAVQPSAARARACVLCFPSGVKLTGASARHRQLLVLQVVPYTGGHGTGRGPEEGPAWVFSPWPSALGPARALSREDGSPAGSRPRCMLGVVVLGLAVPSTAAWAGWTKNTPQIGEILCLLTLW